MTEQWLPVVGFEFYEVSDQGRVRSISRHDSRSHWREGIILKPAHSRKGHFTVCLYLDGKPVRKQIHSLVAEAFIGPRPPGQEVRHGPNGRYDNSVDNLCYGTRAENHADMARDGTSTPFGSTHHFAKLTEADIVTIRQRRARGETYRVMAEEYKVDINAIFLAATGKTWKHVTEPSVPVQKKEK